MLPREQRKWDPYLESYPHVYIEPGRRQHSEEIVMRAIAIVILVLLGFYSANNPVQAQQSSNCKQCSDQRRACMSNYSAKTCKTEYEICMKACQRK
jgi:hypothetical protein